jgi:hypothetical protein
MREGNMSHINGTLHLSCFFACPKLETIQADTFSPLAGSHTKCDPSTGPMVLPVWGVSRLCDTAIA